MKEKAGPALMTTVAMPVFSTKNETVSDYSYVSLFRLTFYILEYQFKIQYII